MKTMKKLLTITGLSLMGQCIMAMDRPLLPPTSRTAPTQASFATASAPSESFFLGGVKNNFHEEVRLKLSDNPNDIVIIAPKQGAAVNKTIQGNGDVKLEVTRFDKGKSFTYDFSKEGNRLLLKGGDRKSPIAYTQIPVQRINNVIIEEDGRPFLTYPAQDFTLGYVKNSGPLAAMVRLSSDPKDVIKVLANQTVQVNRPVRGIGEVRLQLRANPRLLKAGAFVNEGGADTGRVEFAVFREGDKLLLRNIANQQATYAGNRPVFKDRAPFWEEIVIKDTHGIVLDNNDMPHLA